MARKKDAKTKTQSCQHCKQFWLRDFRDFVAELVAEKADCVHGHCASVTLLITSASRH